MRIDCGSDWRRVAAAFAAAAGLACGCGDIHPVHWTKMSVSAARGDVGAVRERMRMDPEAGRYVGMAEANTDVWLESAILSHDSASLATILASRPALNVKLPQSGKTPLALAKREKFDDGVAQLRTAGARK